MYVRIYAEISTLTNTHTHAQAHRVAKTTYRSLKVTSLTASVVLYSSSLSRGRTLFKYLYTLIKIYILKIH